MRNEQLPEETQGFFETMNEFIETLVESNVSESQISGILTLLKTIIGQLKANDELRFYQNELINKHSEMLNYAKNTAQIQEDSLKSIVKVFDEYDDRITKLNNLMTDLALCSSKLGNKLLELGEITAKIPVVDIDNLLETLNEHADEINENTASIKMIKDKLNF